MTHHRRDSRRRFLIQSGTLAATFAATRLAFGQGANAPSQAGAAGGVAGPDHGKTARPLKILVLGGTGLIGPYLVKRAVARGHQVTTFNRNKRDPNAFVGLSVEKLVGDRALGDLKALEGRDWDAVIDLWPSYPKYVRQALDVLVDHCDQYLFVSTILVYEPMDKPQADENAPVLKLPENLDPEKVTQIGAQYGALKALCEQKAEEMMPGQVTIVRPGLIVGPEDDSDRFTYWPLRIAEGGEVLAPGTPDDPMHVIDVRDLAAFLLLCVEESKVGVMNATGPVSGGMRLGEFLDEQKIAPWSDLPGWMSPRRPYGGIGAVSIERALAAGLICRPLVETARDTLAWFKATQKGRALSGGLSREKEKAALAAWHARAKAAPAGGAAGSGSGAKPRS